MCGYNFHSKCVSLQVDNKQQLINTLTEIINEMALR